MNARLITLVLRGPFDVMLARQRARQIAGLVGLDLQDQVRVATAVSEIARNAVTYGDGGEVEFRIEGATVPQILVTRVVDHGPGMADLPAVLAGRYQSPTGLGLGIVGARRLMDHFEIASAPRQGTTVVLKKMLPRRSEVLGPAAIARIADALISQAPSDAFEEVQRQNQELLRAMEELSMRQEQLSALNRELEDTNRGVVALYAELEERAEYLRRADEVKTRFLSNMTHEFRTPVNSIQALSRLLLERTDGDLTSEQERQVVFIHKAADGLAELVNDLLDLAKVEAGKTAVHPTEFDVEHLFGGLRGMLKPLLVGETVALIFDDSTATPPLYSDEAKISQILRNFISNALKFTERGEVRVSARASDDGSTMVFTVADTGIGIAPEDQERIFQEFTQIDSALQRRTQGTGLGLPLCRKLAELLGGHVTVESAPGLGASFTAVIPRIYSRGAAAVPEWDVDPRRHAVLAVDHSQESRLAYERMSAGSAFQILAVRTIREAREALAAVHPKAILLDVSLRDEDVWGFLTELKRRPDLHDVPLAVVGGEEERAKALALGAHGYCVKRPDRHTLLQTLTVLVEPETIRRVLIVDDEEISRYVLRQHLLTPRHVISEACNGMEALRLARTDPPDVICLDLKMPELDGYEILRRLKADPVTHDIPVVIVTSKALDEAERRGLLQWAPTILSKELVSRDAAVSAIDDAIRLANRMA